MICVEKDRKEDILVVSEHGYGKRTDLDDYRITNRGGKGVKAMATREEDYVETVFTASTHDSILFFTNLGKVYVRKGYRIPEAGRSARGQNIVNIIPTDPGEKVSAMIAGRGVTEDNYLVFVTRNGTVKRTAQSAFKNIRSNGIRALSLDEGDELISVLQTTGEDKILLATHDGMAICFAETDARAMGRDAVGVRGIRLREGDYVVGAARVEEGRTVLSITERGFGKRTPVEEYRITNRGGLGIRNYMVTEKTGPVVGMKIVGGEEDLLLVTECGILLRTPVENIRVAGRATQGVIVMRFKEEGDRVISMALAEREEETPAPAEE